MENAEVLMLKNSCISPRIQLVLTIRTSAFPRKWRNIPICCILYSKLEKTAQKLQKVKCQKATFLESKTEKMRSYHTKIF